MNKEEKGHHLSQELTGLCTLRAAMHEPWRWVILSTAVPLLIGHYVRCAYALWHTPAYVETPRVRNPPNSHLA